MADSSTFLMNIVLEVRKGQAEQTLKAVAQAVKNVEDGVQKVTRKFNMWSLSFLFTGMAMKRAGESFFNFAFNKWEQYEGYQGAALDATMRLSAGWEFLRFSIFNALGQSELFQALIGALVDAFNWLSQFVSKHPEIIAIIGALAGISAVLGGAMMVGSVIFQFTEVLKVTKEWYNLRFVGSLLDTGLGALSLFLYGSVGGKGAIIQKLKLAYEWVEKLFKLTFAGTFLEAAFIAMAGYITKLITQLEKLWALMKKVGLIGTISAAVAAAPATAAAIGTVAAGYGAFKGAEYLKEKEVTKTMGQQGISREEALEMMSRNTQDILQSQRIIKAEIVNWDVVNNQSVNSIYG